ncbi:MAG: YHYH protein [Bacteroidota bacterium]
MKYFTAFSFFLLLGGIAFLSSCRNNDDPCIETSWYQDADGDGLGNPDMSLEACEQPDGYVADNTDTDDTGGSNSLHAAFAEFDSVNIDIYLDGDVIVIESNGMANHTSPYWSNTNERTINGPMGEHTTPAASEDHPLFVAPTATSYNQMAPGNIDDFNGDYTLRVPISPELASNSSATGLGPVGIAISGAMIYNDEEGPNVPLDDAVVSLDYNGAHTGPQSYHYHLEPKAWTNDDGNLVGIMADGFFIYGRRDYDGSYPTDLDASGGHFGPTPHNPDGEYHYHIQNEAYLSQYYIIFPGNFQGSPNDIQ